MKFHEHDYEIHFTFVDWQEPLFIKCQGCGSTYYLSRHEELRAAARLANAVEDVAFTVSVPEDLRKLRRAWQAYVDVASDSSHEDSSEEG